MKKILSLLLTLNLIFVFAACSNTNTPSNIDTSTSTPSEKKNIENSIFIEKVKSSVQGAINSKEECIIDVTIEDRNLYVIVDISKTNPDPLTIEDLAISRTSSITDRILELRDYDNQWSTITIDFGNVGKVINKKEDIKENEFGGRYFPHENLTLE